MVRALILVILAGGLVGLMLPSDLGPSATAPTPIVAEPREVGDEAPEPPPTYSPSITPSTNLERQADGHFYAEAQVNGMPVHFLIDTGASGVALTQADARKMGLVFAAHEFTVIGSGASGPVRGKLVMLGRVTLGGKTVENVEGAILEGADRSLLGQSFLGRLGSLEMRGDRMVLR